MEDSPRDLQSGFRAADGTLNADFADLMGRDTDLTDFTDLWDGTRI